MGVLTDVMVIAPQACDGLLELGFTALYEEPEKASNLDLQGVYGHEFKGLDEDKLIEELRALDWGYIAKPPGFTLHVLFQSDFDHQDDSMGGRISPWGWRHVDIHIVRR